MKIGLACLAFLAVPSLAWAEPPLRLKSDWTVVPPGAFATRINKFVRVETETPRATEAYSRGLQHELDQDRNGSAFGVAFVPVAPRAQVYARVGYGGGSGLDRASATESLKYGVGAEYSIGSRNGFRADYTRHDSDRARPKANVISMGFSSKF
jgi:outer membrane immunogenic protein